jgi:hypothetical protein
VKINSFFVIQSKITIFAGIINKMTDEIKTLFVQFEIVPE